MPRPNTAQRTRRLVALLGRLEDGAVISLAEMAAQVDSTPAELAADLTTLSMCGIAPYSPSELVPVSIDGDRVEVFGAMPALRGPVRLSLAEATALSAALSAAGFSAEDTLTGKLAAATSASLDPEELARTLHPQTAGHDVAAFEELAAAVRDHVVVNLEYQREGAEAPSARTIEPLQLFSDRGAWYLSAWCRRAGGFRTFRIDRVRTVTATSEHFDPAARGSLDKGVAAFIAEGLPVARLRFTHGEPFVQREWPGSRLVTQAENGDTVAEVPFAGTRWLARHVAARLGRVEVLEPSHLRAAVVALAGEERSRY